PRLCNEDRRDGGIIACIGAEAVHGFRSERHELARAQQCSSACDAGRIGGQRLGHIVQSIMHMWITASDGHGKVAWRCYSPRPRMNQGGEANMPDIAFARPALPKSGALALLICEGEKPSGIWQQADEATNGAVARALGAAEFKGGKGKTCTVLAPGA